MSRNDLVQRLGYRDPESGQQALRAVMLSGLVAPAVANHFADALDADEALVGSVIEATIRQKRDEARLDRTLWKLQDAISGKKR
jgi:hypothetical protein